MSRSSAHSARRMACERGKASRPLLRRDHHPASVLVPIGVGRHLLRVVLGLQHQRHAEMRAPAVELDLVVAPARTWPCPQRHAAGLRHHGLEVVGLESEPRPVPAHDVLQPRPGKIRPGRGQAVVAVDVDHDRLALLAHPLASIANLGRRVVGLGCVACLRPASDLCDEPPAAIQAGTSRATRPLYPTARRIRRRHNMGP